MKTLNTIKIFAFTVLYSSLWLTSQAQNLTTGLQAELSFSGNTNDASGNGNHGFSSGNVIPTDDRAGITNSAYNLASGHIKVGNQMEITNSISFSLWIKSNSTGNGFILENYNYTVDKGIYLSLVDGNQLRIAGRGGFGGIFVIKTSGLNVTNGQWHHVAGVINGTEWLLYVDNALQASGTSGGTINNNYNSTDRFVIGNWLNGSANQSRNFNGAIDDVKLYNRPLTPADINALFNLAPGTNVTVIPGTLASIWQQSGQDIYYSNGKVGIGTSSPVAKLSIEGGDIQTSHMGHFKGWTNGGVTGLGLDIGVSGGVGHLLTYDRTNAAYHSMRITARGGYNRGLFLHTNGNIGIDDDTPDHKLSVNGTIRSKAIKVEASPWPDYVFDEIYVLQDLSEIAQFISKNGHLPNIPSAEEVEKNGIELGQMSAKLLEKIEELTLHAIQREKEVKNQAILIQELNQRIAKLENSLEK